MKKTYCYRASIFFSALIYDHVKMGVKVTDSFKIIALSAYLFQTKDSTPYVFDFYSLSFPVSCSLPCNILLAVCLLVILSSLPFPSLLFSSHLFSCSEISPRLPGHKPKTGEEKRRGGKRGLPGDRRQVVYYMGENRRVGMRGNRNRRNTGWDPLSERDKLRVLLS